MASHNRGIDTDPGWIRRELKEIRRLLKESDAAKRLKAANIGAGGLKVRHPVSDPAGIELDTDGNLYLVPGTAAVMVAHTTTSASANGVVDAVTGQLRRSTSSARFKQDIADLGIEPAAVLKMRPRIWRDKADVAADPDDQRWYVGFIAEELVAIGGGLETLVEYDADGNPEAIAYDRISVALLALLKAHAQVTADLRQRVTTLEGQVSKLAGALKVTL